MPHPPPVRVKRRERAADVVFRVGAHSAALGERQPVVNVEPESERDHEQNSCG